MNVSWNTLKTCEDSCLCLATPFCSLERNQTSGNSAQISGPDHGYCTLSQSRWSSLSQSRWSSLSQSRWSSLSQSRWSSLRVLSKFSNTQNSQCLRSWHLWLTKQVTHSTGPRPCCEHSGRSAGHEATQLLYGIHKTLPLVPTTSHINAFHITATSVFIAKFRNILPSVT
jgi:hypothetical protein